MCYGALIQFCACTLVRAVPHRAQVEKLHIMDCSQTLDPVCVCNLSPAPLFALLIGAVTDFSRRLLCMHRRSLTGENYIHRSTFPVFFIICLEILTWKVTSASTGVLARSGHLCPPIRALSPIYLFLLFIPH